jgi:hypothetical protein
MEEFHHDPLPDSDASKGKEQGEPSAGGKLSQYENSSNKDSSTKKVAYWASLFQNDEEHSKTCASELGQYSCVKLLREMEAIESDADDEIQYMSLEDTEMVDLPKDLCSDLLENGENKNLPADLYVIPDRMDLDHEKQEGISKNKWGIVLVEPRPSRVPRDGRTIMEKAQDRKKKTNLENTKGIDKSLNPFSILTTVEILEIAECVDISLGKDQSDENETLLAMLDKEKDIDTTFDKACQMCQDLSMGSETNDARLAGSGDDAPCTPVENIITSQDRDLSEVAGQWTLVCNRRKTKKSNNMRGVFWNIRGINQPGRKLSLEQLIK